MMFVCVFSLRAMYGYLGCLESIDDLLAVLVKSGKRVPNLPPDFASALARLIGLVASAAALRPAVSQHLSSASPLFLASFTFLVFRQLALTAHLHCARSCSHPRLTM